MAAGGTPSFVNLGPGRLYVAPLGTTEPVNCSTALPSAWRAIGYTEDGSAFSSDLTNEPVEVAEEVDPIRYILTRRANTLVVTLAETVRKNLGLVFGDSAANLAPNDGAAFEPPDPGVEVAFMLVWDKLDTVDATNRRWVYRQCKAGGTIELGARKAPQKSLIAVTFSLEKPDGLAPFKVFPSSTGLVR